MYYLERIELENFCPFVGRTDIHLSNTKNSILFEGENGGGKTTILNAIRWAIFNKAMDSDNNIISDIKLINKHKLLNMKINDILITRVILTFINTDEKIVISRQIELKRTRITSNTILYPEDYIFKKVTSSDRNNNINNINNKLSVNHWLNEEQQKIGDPSKIIDKLFPSFVDMYYFIYGENFIDPNNSKAIKKAIEDNCYFDILDRIKIYLDYSISKINSENIKETRQKEAYDRLISDKVKIKQEIDNLYSNKDAYEDILTKLNIKYSDIVKKIGSDDDDYIRNLHDKLELNKINLREKKYELKKLNLSYRNLCFNLYIQYITDDSRKKLLIEIDERINRGELPPNIKNEFINKLIFEKKCICGHELGENEIKILESIRENNVWGEKDVHTTLVNIRSNLFVIDNEYYNTYKKIKSIISDIVKLRENIETIKDENKEYDTELNKHATIEQLIKEKKGIEEDIDKFSGLLSTTITDIKNNKNKRNKIEFDLKKYDNIINIKSSIEKRNIDILTKLSSLIPIIKDKLLKNTISNIQKRATETYISICNDPEEVEKIIIDSKYNINIQLKDGTYKTYFSSGEKLVFAISMLTSLRDYSGYKGPLFLDSPYSILDPSHRKKIAERLHNNIAGQLVVCTRKDAYSGVEDKIEPTLANHIIVRKIKDGQNEIEVII